MCAVLRLLAACIPIMLLSFWVPPLVAADSDRSLIEGLEAADSRREGQDILNEIAKRTAEGPLSVELNDRLIIELMSDEMYGYHHIMRTLPELAGEQGYSEQSLIVLAEALSGPLIQQYTPARSIAKALSLVHSTSGLPDPAFSALILALEHIAMLNRSAAIEVLAVTRREDPRYATAMENIVQALVNNDHRHSRSSAVAGLSELAGDQQLPANVLAVLTKTATTDPYMTVRMDALELLATQEIDQTSSGDLSASLAAEIIRPTHELWARSSGIREHGALKDRAVTVLGELEPPPYPDHVISAWIELARSYEPDKSLHALRQVYVRNELTAEQIEELVQVGETHRRAMEREKVYAMLFVELHAGSLMDAIIGFEIADDEAARIRAGYALKEQFRGVEVPEHVADVAARVSTGGSNAELRAIAAGLLSQTNLDREDRESQLLAAIVKHPDDYEIHTAMIDLYGPGRIDQLVVRYATDAELSPVFRRQIIIELGEQAGDESTLSPGAENTLKEVARKADDYYLVQSAGDTLKSWDIRPPLRVALRKRENQSMALFSILVGLIIINIFAIVTALIGISRYPLKIEEKGKRTIVRSAMFSGWFVMTTGIIVLLAAGGIGFLGHNSLPSPTATLLWNLPAYLGTVVYVLLTWWIWRQGRQAIPITDQAVPVHR